MAGRVSNGTRLAAAAVVSICALVAAVLVPHGAVQISAALDHQAAPEAATGRAVRALAKTQRTMVAAAHPLAAQAGRDMLRAGGSAIDAAIATQLVLNIVEPQSSGLGGGAFLLYWDAQNRTLTAYDGRESAPAAARPERFMRGDEPMPLPDAVHGGTSIGAPGVARLLDLVHKRHGKLAWPSLFGPAIKLADAGFAVSPRLSKLLQGYGSQAFDAQARRFYFDAGGSPWPPGYLLKSPDFARTLRLLTAGGADAFYSGPIAQAIVTAVTDAPNRRGDLTLADLAAYRARERDVVCVSYRQVRICGIGPPSSGGLGVGMTMALLADFDLGRVPLATEPIHLIAEAEKIAYADRDHYIADPDFVAVPRTLLDPAYMAARRQLMSRTTPAAKVPPGVPPGVKQGALGVDGTVESVGTSHVSIVDEQGNAVALTTTVESAFGSRIMAAGFLLNNQLTDFSLRPRAPDGSLAANAVAPGKRPRSTMAPTIVLDAEGREVRMVLGSPGGSRIILYVVKALVALIDWGLDAQAAADLTAFGSRNGPFEAETGAPGADLAVRLAAMGHRIVMDDMTSGLHIIVRQRDGRLEGGADARREGAALGD